MQLRHLEALQLVDLPVAEDRQDVLSRSWLYSASVAGFRFVATLADRDRAPLDLLLFGGILAAGGLSEPRLGLSPGLLGRQHAVLAEREAARSALEVPVLDQVGPATTLEAGGESGTLRQEGPRRFESG